jgi:hypothetical protein
VNLQQMLRIHGAKVIMLKSKLDMQSGEEQWEQMSLNLVKAAKERAKKRAQSSSGKKSACSAGHGKKRKSSYYQGRLANVIEDTASYQISVNKRPGSDYICIELFHELSRYRDRVVIRDGENVRVRISNAKKQLVTRFLVERNIGMHWEQRYRNGEHEFFGQED